MTNFKELILTFILISNDVQGNYVNFNFNKSGDSKTKSHE